MRRFIAILFALMLVLALAFSAGAAVNAPNANAVASVNADESCAVTLTVTVHLDQPMDKLSFPVPKDATAVTLNGSRVIAMPSNP